MRFFPQNKQFLLMCFEGIERVWKPWLSSPSFYFSVQDAYQFRKKPSSYSARTKGCWKKLRSKKKGSFKNWKKRGTPVLFSILGNFFLTSDPWEQRLACGSTLKGWFIMNTLYACLISEIGVGWTLLTTSRKEPFLFDIW